MSGSIYGKLFKISTWGESHGKGVGVVIDGVPSGLELCEEDIQVFLDRRKPGQSKYTTKRNEADSVNILSGVFEGKTTGTPISLIVYNEDQHSKDYSNISDIYRPGHADYCFDTKYGFRDYRGGGRSSGRETIARVAAGAVASKILARLGIQVNAYASEIAGIKATRVDLSLRDTNPFGLPDSDAAQKAATKADEAIKSLNSLGGIVECIVDGCPVGIGETVFDKLDARMAQAVMSIGAVKGFEIGDGFAVSESDGVSNNDEFYMNNGKVDKRTNHSGGILGGMSDGSRIIMRAAFKPTPSIASVQKTVNKSGEEVEISIHGRHDPLIVPRAIVVVESMVCITILDLLLENMTARLDKIIDFYS
ncbi:MAG: chorismate synthase [Clostridiales bacterium]|nr:chorismate synthase [Clostridiales bacterium]